MKEEYGVKDGRLTVAERETQWFILRGICERELIQQEKFPVPVTTLAENLMPPDEYEAYCLLAKHETAIRMKSTQPVKLPRLFTTGDRRAADVRILGENALILATNEGHWSKSHDAMSSVFIDAYEEGLPLVLKSKYYNDVMQWAEEQWQREERTLTALGSIQYLLSKLNTIGQIKRAAGELLPFFSERFQEAASKYTKKSALPKEFRNDLPKKLIDFTISHVSRNSLLPRTASEEEYYRTSWRDVYDLPTAVRFHSYGGDPRRNVTFRT